MCGVGHSSALVSDQGINQAVWEDVQEAQSERLADKTASIEPIISRDYEDNMRVFAESGEDMVVTVGNGARSHIYDCQALP